MPTRLAEPADPRLVADLTRFARRCGGSDGPVVLSHRTGELVVRCGSVVVKAHAADTDRAALTARLAVADTPALRDVLLAPLDCETLAGRPVTAWPAGVPLRPAQAPEAPWETAGELLARLHAATPPVALPPAGGPARVRRAIRRLATSPAVAGPRARTVFAAYRSLPAWARGETGAAHDPASPQRSVLTHGDWHLGQLVRFDGGWRLIDLDDLGTGEPAWDLARPAAWFAAGVVPPLAWHRFLSGYHHAGGHAVPPTANPWPVLDVPARALAVQAAALAIAGGDLDVAEDFVACCRRMNAERTGRPRPRVHALSKLLRV